MSRGVSSMLHAWTLLVLATCGLSCQKPAGETPAQVGAPAGSTDAPLRIAAASDLQLALPEVAAQFRAKSGISTTLTFAASGQLAEQIRNGAPFDLFMSANVSFVEGLVKDGSILADSVHPYAQGSLMVAVTRELGDRVRTLNDLERTEVKKIAVANPATAPYGKAARQALERAGLWKRLEPKIVQAESVKQALVYAERGDAEAALVGRALANNLPEVRTFAIDPSLYDPIVQAMGIVATTPRNSDAAEFARFVLSEEGQAILKQFGFAPPVATKSP